MEKKLIYILLTSCLTICSCKKSYNYPNVLVTDYMQLQPGKYVTYRLDSLVFLNFGTRDTIISYLARDIVDTAIADDAGRPSWRVVRYLSDTTGTQPWTPTETYMITPTNQSLEVVENNMRYLKLEIPIINSFSWMGNRYIDTRTTFTNVPGLGSWDYSYMGGWNYTYDSVGMPFLTLAGLVPNTITIHQNNDSIGTPSHLVDSLISSRTFSEEIYAKGIGLIYKNFIYWEFQPGNVSNPQSYTVGYGIKLNMVDHN